ncbi:ABC transporter ATP-binding protein [Aneurinibacillus terranovensis]|uniref:ABC transporter ATP-binding protein n=1 Tax=Aneurinibacillus terranovensis TaxID=278991 RepID=UPI00041E1471|nr:ABC transporter ATP-binding protein [Aneurinibacillus terranovensis]
MIDVQQISYRAENIPILTEIDFRVNEGETVGIIGPNGSGKSTLVKILSRVLKPDQGEVYIDGKKLADYPSRILARKLAVVNQGGIAASSVEVEEVVAMGRYPYQRFWQRESKRDRQAIYEAMERTGIAAIAHKKLDELSGGERQRVAIASSFAQQAKILLLDEPTTYLDIGYQVSILNLVRSWQRETGGTILLVLHDLNLAAQYCDRLLLIEQGRITRGGCVNDIINAPLLQEVYGTEPLIVQHPTLNVPQILLQRATIT